MRFEPMTESTVTQVAQLEAACFSTPWSEGSIREELTNEWAIWIVALEGAQLAGYIGVQFGPDGADIMTIATAPAFRKKDIGQTLITMMVKQLRQKQLKWLTLEVRPSNIAAIRFYTALGFEQVGRRPRYYQKPTEDAILMTLFFKEDEVESC